MHLAGADEIYALGGVHALAAFALGTESIARVEVVNGSGDLALVEAARQLFGSSRLDLAVGATEILIIADDSADPALVAADLIGPCEHAAHARGVLVTTSAALAACVTAEIERTLGARPFAEAARLAWRQHGAIHVVQNADDACAHADRYAVGAVEILPQDRQLSGVRGSAKQPRGRRELARQWRREGFDGQAHSCELRAAVAEEKQLFGAEIAWALV